MRYAALLRRNAEGFANALDKSLGDLLWSSNRHFYASRIVSATAGHDQQ